MTAPRNIFGDYIDEDTMLESLDLEEKYNDYDPVLDATVEDQMEGYIDLGDDDDDY